MGQKVFYKKRLQATEEGLEVFTEKWFSLRETEHFYFCVHQHELRAIRILKKKDETELDVAKRRKTLKRISKNSGRFAFETEEKALEHLRFLKRKQVKHISRDLELINAFLAADQLEKTGFYSEKVPESRDLVREYYIFD